MLKISDNDFYFKVLNWQVETLKEFKKEKLMHNEDETVSAEPEDISNG